MGSRAAGRPEPLANHPKYEKARREPRTYLLSDRSGAPWAAIDTPPLFLQIKDLNSGTFGFVQLCKDKTTQELVAIKFIERGEKVCTGLTRLSGQTWRRCMHGGVPRGCRWAHGG